MTKDKLIALAIVILLAVAGFALGWGVGALVLRRFPGLLQ